MPSHTLDSTEPIAGYKLVERLGSGGFGEVWKCEAPGGLFKAIKIVHGNFRSANGDEMHAEQELEALERMKTVHHPYILSLERYDIVDGQLFIVMELADRSLWDRFEECRTQALPGIPRDELLGYMEETAEALDLINTGHQLQHLDVKPQNLFLVHNHIKVADFGLVKDLSGKRVKLTSGISPVYAASELFDGLVSPFSDQYSLAIVYQEMLTGHRPFAGTNRRQLILQHISGAPHLEPLPPRDRLIIAQALAKNPEDRFPSCTELVRALRQAPALEALAARAAAGDNLEITPLPGRGLQLPRQTELLNGQGAGPAADPRAPVAGRSARPSPEQLVRDLVHRAIPNGVELQEYDGLRCLVDAKDVLHHRSCAWLPEGAAEQKLDGFLGQWPTRVVHRDAGRVQVHVSLKAGLWQWLGAEPPTIEVHIVISRPRPAESQLSEIAVHMRCLGGRRNEVRHVLARVGPVLLNSLRSYLQASGEHRAHERFPFEQPLRFTSFLSAQAGGAGAIECEGRDISLSGIRFRAPCRPPTMEILLYFRPAASPAAASAPVVVPARVQQVAPDGRGGFLVGARFLLDPVVHSRRVLLIEEDPVEARRIDSLLAESGGLAWQLQYAGRLDHGLEILGSEPVDVVLLALSLPDAQAVQAWRRVHAAVPAVPIVVLVEPDQVSVASQVVEEGAQAYLVKNQGDATLLPRTLHEAMERQRAKHDHDLQSERQHLLTALEKAKLNERYLTHHDVLTGLPNRLLFADRLAQALAQAGAKASPLAVLFLNLDGLKPINAALGHAAGDHLLQAVAQRLQGCLRQTDTVARLGSDEFAIILTYIARGEAGVHLAEKVLGILAQPLVLAGQELSITASIGISLFPADGRDVETLVKRADRAMSGAKEQGKNTYQAYHPSLDTASPGGLVLKNDLRKALEKGELVVHYQPQVALGTRAIQGVEALPRWQHPERGLIAPGKFIQLAEETGLLVPLWEWVLRTACAANRAWQVAGLLPLRTNVNVSARQFRDTSFPNTVARILAETGLASHFLGLEITDSSAIQDADATIRMLRVLKDMGVQLYLDGFGTASSTLLQLKQFPIDGVKIDQSLLKGLPASRADVAIATAVIDLAHKLELRVIAKQVETREQLAMLQALHCDEAQSFLLFYPPLPADRLARLLQSQSREAPRA